MTNEALLADKNSIRATMWSNLRCNRNYIILFLLCVIVYQSISYYHELCKWQEIIDEVDKSVSEQRALNSMTYSILNKIERTLHPSYSVIESTTGDTRPIIYAITPTFARPVQKAELVRLSQTFLHVPNFHWIVVEDAAKKTNLVSKLLNDSGLIYTHLNIATPMNYKLGKNDPNWKKPRGVEQRNTGLKWLRENLKMSDRGIVYFADDDNTYSVRLFREMEKIKKVGVWPVGLVGGLMVEKPICDNATNKVIGFNAAWKPSRPFPLDMAGFAINLTLILEKKDALFSYEIQDGYQETEILRQITTREELEPLAECCTKVYVWHTRTEPPRLNIEQMLIKKGKPSNAGIEV